MLDPPGALIAGCSYSALGGLGKFLLRLAVQPAADKHFNRVVDLRYREKSQFLGLSIAGRDLDALDQVPCRSLVLQHVDDTQQRCNRDDLGSLKSDTTNQSSEAGGGIEGRAVIEINSAL